MKLNFFKLRKPEPTNNEAVLQVIGDLTTAKSYIRTLDSRLSCCKASLDSANQTIELITAANFRLNTEAKNLRHALEVLTQSKVTHAVG